MKIFEIDRKKKFPFIFFIITLSILSFLLSGILVFILEKMPLNKLSLITLLSLYLKKSITIKVFLLLEIISLAISLMLVIDMKWYQAKQIKITKDIYIPVKTGQNQHGSAKFADKKDYDDMFDNVIIDITDEEELLEKSERVYNFVEVKKEIIDKLIDELDSK